MTPLTPFETILAAWAVGATLAALVGWVYYLRTHRAASRRMVTDYRERRRLLVEIARMKDGRDRPCPSPCAGNRGPGIARDILRHVEADDVAPKLAADYFLQEHNN